MRQNAARPSLAGDAQKRLTDVSNCGWLVSGNLCRVVNAQLVVSRDKRNGSGQVTVTSLFSEVTDCNQLETK